MWAISSQQSSDSPIAAVYHHSDRYVEQTNFSQIPGNWNKHAWWKEDHSFSRLHDEVRLASEQIQISFKIPTISVENSSKACLSESPAVTPLSNAFPCRCRPSILEEEIRCDSLSSRTALIADLVNALAISRG